MIQLRATCTGFAVLILLAVAGPVFGQPPAILRSDRLSLASLNRLGTNTPTGAGVLVTQVEAQESANAYLPNATVFPGQIIIDRTGGGAVSGHATTVGRHFLRGPEHRPGDSRGQRLPRKQPRPGGRLAGGRLPAHRAHHLRRSPTRAGSRITATSTPARRPTRLRSRSSAGSTLRLLATTSLWSSVSTTEPEACRCFRRADTTRLPSA